MLDGVSDARGEKLPLPERDAEPESVMNEGEGSILLEVDAQCVKLAEPVMEMLAVEETVGELIVDALSDGEVDVDSEVEVD